MRVVLAHSGVEDVTGQGLLQAWSWDPLAVAGLGLLALLYTRGVARSSGARLQVIAWWRPVLFYTGAGTILLALVSPLDALAAHLFAAHMVQHMLLIMVGVPLALLGAPVLPLMRGIPHAIRSAFLAPLARWRPLRRLGRSLTAPLVAWPLHVGTFWAWHLPGLYDAALQNEAVHIVQHVSFLLTAVLFWWNIIDPVPFRGRLSYPGRFVYLILAVVQATPLAAGITFASTPWYRAYAQSPRLWGVDPLADQALGGLIMWVGGWTIYLLAFSIVFFMAASREEQGAPSATSPSSARSDTATSAGDAGGIASFGPPRP
ncbi:MAG: cytochrome c oxidase assembly protein [Chloroflexi bacterium]|nr:cytochrome c oxidase assembly protein [Chloroflexota bacterium]